MTDFMHNPYYQFFVNSFLAGVCIGLGCVIYVACPLNYIGTFLFAVGLLTVIIKHYLLYTGKVGDWTPKTTLRIVMMFIINGIGCALTGYLFTLTHTDLSHVGEIAQHKLSGTLTSSFVLAMGCGAMMHIAYYNYNANKHPLLVIMPVMLFMLAGFEHSVANTGLFAMAEALGYIDMGPHDFLRLLVIVLGNGVGAWVFTKFLPKEEQHVEVHTKATSSDGKPRV